MSEARKTTNRKRLRNSEKELSFTHFKPCGTPLHKLNGPLGLESGDGRVDVIGRYVTTEEHAAGHVLATSGVTLHHLVGRLEASVAQLTHR